MADASRRVQRAAHRLADLQTQRLASIPSARLLIATVATVTAGATDGGSVVTLTWRGDSVTAAAYITPHVPIVGQRSLCAVIDDQLIILGRLGGFPPEL